LLATQLPSLAETVLGSLRELGDAAQRAPIGELATRSPALAAAPAGAPSV
jgi:hypothetical protein